MPTLNLCLNFKRLNLLKLPDLFTTTILKFFYKHENNTLPSYFKNMFRRILHSHYTRNRHSLHRDPHPKQCTGIRLVLPKIIDNTSQLITDKIQTHSFQGFAQYTKKYMISQYENECHITNCYIFRN